MKEEGIPGHSCR